MKHLKLFAALCCAAAALAACDKTDEPPNDDLNDNNSPVENLGPTTGTENGHEWVDLGPSVKWATCNVGATAPEEYGGYFAWGETDTKETYIWDTYKHCAPANTWTTEFGYDLPYLTKYCTNAEYGKEGFIDNKTVLDPEDDAAVQNWDGAWRMPTIDEWQELIDNCDLTWTDNYNGTGVAGYIVTSKNGNSIFLPAAGGSSDLGLLFAGDSGWYWSSSLAMYDMSQAWNVYLASNYKDKLFTNNRCYGFSVRPVLIK